MEMNRLQGKIMGVVGALVLAGCGVFLAGCAAESSAGAGGAGFGPGYPGGSAAWSQGARGAYRLGFLAGGQDQGEGFRFDDDRGALQQEVDERGYFRQGYRRGYYYDAGLRRQAAGQTGHISPNVNIP